MPAQHMLLLSHDDDAYLPMYNRLTGEIVRSFAPSFTSASPVFSADGTKLATGFSSAPRYRVIDPDTGVLVTGLPNIAGIPIDMDLSPNGQRLAIVHATSPRFSVVDLVSKTLVAGSKVYGSDPRSVRYSPDGTMIAVSSISFPRTEIFLNSDLSLIQSLTNPAATIPEGAAWSPDGSMLAQGFGGAPYICAWETTGWTLVPGLPVMSSTVTKVSWSPDGAYIACALSSAPFLAVIRVSDWTVLSGVYAPGSAVSRVAYSPNNELAVTFTNAPHAVILSQDGSTVLWQQDPTLVKALGVAWSPASALQTISGTVLDTNGAPAVRDLLLLHDASAAIIGQTTSAADGSYAFETGYADGHTVLLLEDTGRVQAIGGGVLPL